MYAHALCVHAFDFVRILCVYSLAVCVLPGMDLLFWDCFVGVRFVLRAYAMCVFRALYVCAL